MREVGDRSYTNREDNAAKEDAAKEGVEEQASLCADEDYRTGACC